jgi:hypothetical protein
LLFAAAAAAAATVAGGGNATMVVVVVDAALSARNPNAHATALYDQLRASASYGGVTAGAPLPPLEQPDQGDAVMSVLLTSGAGGPLPVPGGVLRVRVEGQLRWKVAAWVSGGHGLAVDCVAAVAPSSAGPQCASNVQ